MVAGSTTRGAALAPSNRQAQTALVDWLGVTFYTDVYTVLELLGGGDDWLLLGRGWKGYANAYQRGSVTVWFGGDREQGVNVQASGQGCRELEGAGVVTDWVRFLGKLLEWEGRFTRLDVAMDDRAGLLNKEAIEQAIVEGRIVSRYSQVHDHGVRSLSDAGQGDTFQPAGSSQGWTRKFGANSSETSLTFYDKYAEQIAKGKEVEEGHWMRCELRTRREKAQALARVIVEHGMQGVAGAVRQLLEFKEKGNHSQRERWDCSDWWSAFLDGAAKIPLTLAPVVRTIEDVKVWFFKSVAPLAAVIFDHERQSPEKSKFLRELITEGRERRRTRHKQLLQMA